MPGLELSPLGGAERKAIAVRLLHVQVRTRDLPPRVLGRLRPPQRPVDLEVTRPVHARLPLELTEIKVGAVGLKLAHGRHQVVKVEFHGAELRVHLTAAADPRERRPCFILADRLRPTRTVLPERAVGHDAVPRHALREALVGAGLVPARAAGDAKLRGVGTVAINGAAVLAVNLRRRRDHLVERTEDLGQHLRLGLRLRRSDRFRLCLGLGLRLGRCLGIGIGFGIGLCRRPACSRPHPEAECKRGGDGSHRVRNRHAEWAQSSRKTALSASPGGSTGPTGDGPRDAVSMRQHWRRCRGLLVS